MSTPSPKLRRLTTIVRDVNSLHGKESEAENVGGFERNEHHRNISEEPFPSRTIGGSSLAGAIERMEKKERTGRTRHFTIATAVAREKSAERTDFDGVNPTPPTGVRGRSTSLTNDTRQNRNRPVLFVHEPRQSSEPLDITLLLPKKTGIESPASPSLSSKLSNTLPPISGTKNLTAESEPPMLKRSSTKDKLLRVNTIDSASVKRHNLPSAGPTMSHKDSITYFLSKDYRKDPLWQIIGKQNSHPEKIEGGGHIHATPQVSSHNSNTQEKDPRKNSTHTKPEIVHEPKSTKNWSKLFYFNQFALRIVKLYKKHAEQAAIMMRDTVSKGVTLSNVHSRPQYQPDPFIVDKVKKILVIPPTNRTEDDLNQLQRFLTVAVPDFAKFPPKERLSFSKLMTLETYDTGKLLFREKHRPSCFYFILSGQIEIFKLNNGVRDCLNFVGAGKIIGHRIFDYGNVRRTACAATSMPTNLLYINKDNYSLVMDKNKAKTSAIIYEKLHNTPLFENQEQFLKSILPFFKMYSYGRNQVIQEEGKQTMEFYFILEGTCRVTQLIYLNKYAARGRGKDQVTRGGSEVMIPVETLQISVGDSFPPIPDLHPDGSLKYLGPSVIDNQLYVDFYTNLKMNDSRTFSKATLECEFEVSVAAIPFSDFFRLAPKEVVFSLVVEPRVKIFTPEEVQKQFEIESKWRGYRKSIIAEYQV